VPGTPQEGDPQIYVALLSAIRHAEKNVFITTAYFDPTEEARQVLAEAARRGVDVELSVEGETDSEATLAAGRSRYAELLQAGVNISDAARCLPARQNCNHRQRVVDRRLVQSRYS
jgi:cardiolipin synthase